MTTNMIANMSKEGKHIGMDTLARICETLNCEITDVIELVPDEPASTGGKDISFFVTILRQLREDMPEVVVWAQIVQLCCF